MPPRLQRIIRNYIDEILQVPVANLGSLELSMRHEFAVKKALELMSSGPAVLVDDTAEALIHVGLCGEQVTITFGDDVIGAMAELIGRAITDGLSDLLRIVELKILSLPDEVLASMSVNGSDADTYRSLASEFVGTFDELIDVARTL